MEYSEEVRDLFSVPECYFLAHCISADFGMGKGIAVEFNRRFNMKARLMEKYPQYLDVYERHRIGGDCLPEGRVLNLVTKERYWHKPTIITMHLALKKMRQACEEESITKVAMPLIGAGLDRLCWDDVSGLLQHVFADTDVEVLVCRLK